MEDRMENTRSSSQFPARPGHVQRIQSIDSLQVLSTPNDYVQIGISAAKSKLSDDKVHKRRQTHIETLYDGSIIDKPVKKPPQSEPLSTPTIVDCSSPLLPPRRRALAAAAASTAPPLPPRTFGTSSAIAQRCQHLNIRCHYPQCAKSLSGRISSSSCNGHRHGGLHTHTNDVGRFSQEHEHHAHQRKPLMVVITNQPQPQQNVQLPVMQTKSLSRRGPQEVANQIESSFVVSKMGNSSKTKSSILCPGCGQCRCASCTGDKHLPEHWFCEGNCLCSAESVVDTVSCMCCVKGCFQIFFDQRGKHVHPCSCGDVPNLGLRWLTLTALTICLPCLLCYWPMKGGVAATTALYNSHCCRGQHGCTCNT